MARKYVTVKQYAEENNLTEWTARRRLDRGVEKGLYKKRLVREVDLSGRNCEKGPQQYNFPHRPAFAQYWKVDE